MMITSPHKRSRSNRKRAKTYDLAKAPLSPGQESSSIPLIDFNGFYTKNIQESVENMDLDSLCDIDETKYSTIYEQMIESFRSLENNNTNVLDYDHDQNLIKMQNMILNIIPKEVSSKIYGLWPPIIPTDNENVQNLIFLIIKIIQASPNQMKALQWFSRSLLPLDCPDSHSHSNSLVKGICLCHRKRKMLREKRFFWAEIMNDNTFTLYLIQDNELILKSCEEYGSIKLTNGNNVVNIIAPDGITVIKRFIPVDKEQALYWSKIGTNESFAFPLMLTSIERPFPSSIIPGLYEAIISDDMLIVRCLIFYKVSKISNGTPLVDALLDIFAHAGKVNELLLTLVGSEFEKDSLTQDQILRSNSHLTNLFKVFYKRYGITYYNSFLRKVIKYIDKQGDISMQAPINAPESRCRLVVFTVLKHILKSAHYIPPQIRHLASILKSCATVRFNSKQATYNTLNGFFCLRFLTAILADPKQMDPELVLENDTTKVLIPFSSLLTTIFNLIPLANRFEAFNTWNHRLKKRIFPKLTDFILSIAEIDEIPSYNPPNPERLKGALEFVFLEISNNHHEFHEKYNQLVNEKSKYPLVGWNFGSFLQSFFKENIVTINDTVE